MTDSTSSHDALKSRTNELEGTTLSEVANDIEKNSVQVRFKHWDGRSIIAYCEGVVLCNVSVLDQNGRNSEVIGARLEIFESGGIKPLVEGGYLWRTGQNHVENFSYPLFKLSLDGDTCVVIFCGKIDLN